MTKLKTAALAATALCALAATPAKAVLQFAFTDGTSVFTCADQQVGCDFDPSQKNVVNVFATVGNFSILATVATSSSGSVNNLEITNAVIRNAGSLPETLTMVVGDTGFTAPVHSIDEAASLTFNNNIGPTSTLKFWADGADIQPAGTGLATPGPLQFTTSGHATGVSQAFSGNASSLFDAFAPFSMTEGASLNMLGGSSITGFSESMTTAAIPEPRTWALLALGFMAMALVGYKRKRAPRLSFDAG